MSDPKWVEFVTEFCIERGIVRTEAIIALRRSDCYILAHRQFHFGGDERDVIRLLEKALTKKGR